MIVVLVLVAVIAAITWGYMRQDKFGKAPSGARLTKMEQAENFKDGKFQNISHTPPLAEGYSMTGVTMDFFFKKFPRTAPVDTIPTTKTDLLNLSADSNVLVWFGHSSYFMQIDGKKFLVDPVLSGNASPVPGSVKSFPNTDQYTLDDIPEIDHLFISHDHYDHLDYKTITGLKGKVKHVICGLGVGEHFEHWGYDTSLISEGNWGDKVELGDGFTAFITPSRHFSGRGFTRNNTLWASYVLQSPSLKIFIGGDSGYDTHYVEIGQQHGPFDLAVMENGQYNKAWEYIHHLPEQVLQAATDLRAKRVFPVHSSKFKLANHPWDEPLKKITEYNQSYSFPLVTPIIGELVNLNDTTQSFEQWWLGME